MYLIKKVGRRTKGMGLKLVKFHRILHYTLDILNFGVPLEYDTCCNESGHKETKRAALLTQKNHDKFDLQVSMRKEEMRLLELAEEEINGRCLWKYGARTENFVSYSPKEGSITVGGTEFYCFFCQ